MRKILVTCTLLLAAVFLTQPASAQKFKNEDTAKNRKDNTFGTPPREEGTTAGSVTTDEDGSTIIKADPGPKKEEVDWYDKVIITVDPNVDWNSTK